MSKGGWGSGWGGAKKRAHEEVVSLDDAAEAPVPSKSQKSAPTPAAVGSASAPGAALQHALNGNVAALRAALDAEPVLLERPQQGGLFDSRTLLQCAAARGHEAAARLLLERGADARATDKRGATAAALAAKQGHAALAALLEGGGAAAAAPAVAVAAVSEPAPAPAASAPAPAPAPVPAPAPAPAAGNPLSDAGHGASAVAAEPSGAPLAAFVGALRLPPATAAQITALLVEWGYDDPADYANLEAEELADIERDMLAAAVPKGHVGKAVRAIRAAGAAPPAAPPQAPAPAATAPQQGAAPASRAAVGGPKRPRAPNGEAAPAPSTQLNPQAAPFVPAPSQPAPKRARAPERAPPAAAAPEPAVPAAAAGGSALQHALNGNVAALRAALDAEPALLERPQQGGLFDSRTLLQCAAARGHEAAARLLLERGADARATDKRGATAAALAAKQGHAALAALLEGGGAAAAAPAVAVAAAPGSAPAASAPAPTPAEDAATDDVPSYSDAELLDTSDGDVKAAGALEGEEQAADDIYGILNEGDDDLE